MDYFPQGIELLFLPKLPNLLVNALLVPYLSLQYGIDVVLFQNFGSAWPGKLRKIVYLHDVLFLDYPQYYTRGQRGYFSLMKTLAAHAQLIVTISETEKKRLVDHGIHAEKGISTVYHGIDNGFKPAGQYEGRELQEVAERYHLPDRYLLYVGRVDPRKNLENLICSIKFLEDQHIKLVITGELGRYSEGLKREISSTGLSGRLIFTGTVPRADLPVIYALATVFCFPSYAEGFGLPPLEAMRCGVPVVVSKRTAMPEICGEAAIYVEPDDKQDIAGKLNMLLADKDKRQQTGLKGLAHARRFSWEKAAGQLLDIITQTYAA
jgi:glycosyltransferase involved in cell wall biosynthesis